MMASTLSSLGATQTRRLQSYPEQISTHAPARESVLEAFRQRNAFLDAFFYDVGTISKDEAATLAPQYAAEGSILAVGPSASPSLEIWPDFDSFVPAGAPSYAALVVAGVGSSALGAAAFARNVADSLNAPVLTVVSGYGLADLLNEAIGGYFLFGYLNSVRHFFEPLDDLTRPQSTKSIDTTVDVVRRSRDVRTLKALLDGERHFELLIGHSKGNLVISEALYAIEDDKPERLQAIAAATNIITFSARIAMPRAFKNVIDVLGTLDGFGLLNSRHFIATDVSVEHAWHHTNREIPFHLPVTKTLTEALTHLP